jgi:hypothetical protein
MIASLLGVAMGDLRGRTKSVRADWQALLPVEMDRLFDSTRSDLRISTAMINVILNEALGLCAQGEIGLSREQAQVFAELFDRLASNLRVILLALKGRGTHFVTLPIVTALDPDNFRGEEARKISRTNHFLATLIFHGRTRFFHKLYALREIIEDLQEEVRESVAGIDPKSQLSANAAWKKLEVLGYDLHTCTSEVTILMKSFLLLLAGAQLADFQRDLTVNVPVLPLIRPRRGVLFRR